MKRFFCLFALLVLCLPCITAKADIYVWTDENGVKHFTNLAPPPQATLLMKTPEIAYDAAADREQREEERKEKLVLAWQEIAEEKAQLAEMQRQAEQRLAAADRKVNERLQQVEELLNEAQDDSYYGNGYISYGYYPYKHYDRYPHKIRYYRKNYSIYYKKPHPRRGHHYQSGKYGDNNHRHYGAKKYHSHKNQRRNQQSLRYGRPYSAGLRGGGSLARATRR